MRSKYVKSLVIFGLSLAVIGIFFLAYVSTVLIEYEKSVPDNYIEENIKNGIIASKYDDSLNVNEYDDSKEIKESLNKYYNSKKLTKVLSSSTEDTYTYDVSVDNNKILEISLKKNNTKSALGLLTINDWSINNIKYFLNEGYYHYFVSIPDNYKLYVNNKEVKDGFTAEGDDSLKEVVKYTNITEAKTINLDNFVSKPTISVLNENDLSMDYESDGYNIYYDVKYDNVDVKDTGFDVLAFAEMYSLYLTKDLSGAAYGFYNFTPYLIKDSNMYKLIYNWAYNYDINFTSSHTLLDPIFTDEKVTNCIKYSNDAFSCDVTLKKNMQLTKSGQVKIDTMNERMFFVRVDGQVKFVDIQSLGNS